MIVFVNYDFITWVLLIAVALADPEAKEKFLV